MRRPSVFLAFGALALAVADASGYEAQPTHVGLTERAAAAGRLHDLLTRHWGQPLGLYQPLRWKAPQELAWRLGQLDPIEGLRPDEQGENTALGWLLAGAALEGMPPVRERHHFFDPQTGRGLAEREPLTRTFFFLFGNRQVGGSFDLSGRPTPEWAVAPPAQNDLGLPVLLDGLEQSAAAATAEARAGALAHALLAMGALLHLIEDMGVPGHVRNDFRGEHMQRMPGSSPWDQRSL